MRRFLAGVTGLLAVIGAISLAPAQTSLNNVILGHSGGAGSLGNLRRIIERDKLWEKHGLNVKSVYFSSGGILTQAMAGGNIAGSESEVPGMLNLAVSGVLDLKLVTVTINKIEHVFIVRKTITKPEDLKGKRLAISRIGSASDTVTRLVLKSWKIDPDKEVTVLQSGNTPTRMTALAAGHVDGALVSPESIHKILASNCCRILADLSELPMDYARYGYVFPTAWLKANRDVVRRLLMGYLEGIAIFRTRPQSRLRGPRRRGHQRSGGAKRHLRTRAQACARVPRAGAERHSKRPRLVNPSQRAHRETGGGHGHQHHGRDQKIRLYRQTLRRAAANLKCATR